MHADSILKSRGIILPTKVHLVKVMFFPVVMYGCENCTIKRTEHWRIDDFELWCWRRLFRVPQTAMRPNQSWRKSLLNIHWKDWCWSWNSNTLATCCEELTHWKRPWCWERWKARGEVDDRGLDGWMASPFQWTWVWVDSASCWWTGKPGVLQYMGSQRVWPYWATELNWTDGSDSKESTFNVGDLCLIPGLWRSLGEWHGNTPLYSSLDKGASPQGQRCLVGYSPWGHKESDMTEWLSIHIMFMDQKN